MLLGWGLDADMVLSLQMISLGLLVMSRFVGLMLAAPFLGMASIPTRIRVALVMLMTYLVLTTQEVSPDLPTGMGTLAILAMAELLVGVGVGMIASFCIHGVRMAGELAGSQMGLGFGALVDPMSGDQSTVLARFLSLVALAVIVSLNGHHILLRGIAEGFASLPPGTALAALPHAAIALPMAAGSIFVSAVVVAAPAIATVFCIKIGMAILARSAPQLHILAIGFIITITVGVLTFAFSLTSIGNALRHEYTQGAEKALAIFSLGA